MKPRSIDLGFFFNSLFYNMNNVTDAEVEEIVASRKLRDEKYQECFEKWKDSPLLEGIDPKHAITASVILENQKLYLELFPPTNEKIAQMAMEVTAKTLQGLCVFDLVSVQPSLSPVCFFHYHNFRFMDKNGDPEVFLLAQRAEYLTRTRKVVKDWDVVEDLACEMRKAITQEVITDLTRNAGTWMTKKDPDPSYETIYINLMEMYGVLHRKTLRRSRRWILVSPRTAQKFNASYQTFDVEGLTEVKLVGCLNSCWNMYVDSSWPDNKILCGSFESEESGGLDGYFYGPYVMISQGKEGGMVTRYSKALKSPKHYGLIVYEK